MDYFRMSRVCVVTSKARAYYALASRLRKAGLSFASVLPDSGHDQCDLVLTTSAEAPGFGKKVLALEDLDENPGVFKGQVISRMEGEDEYVLVGIDPGKRTGLAVFYGETSLAFNTFNSLSLLGSRVGAFAAKVPSRGVVVRIGNGNKAMAARLSELLGREVPWAVIEIVDESGTSARSAKMKGVAGDQRAAARIAFRKGQVVSHLRPKSRG